MQIRALLAVVSLSAFGASAGAAPMSGSYDLSISILGLPTLSAAGSGTIDVSGGVITVPAGLVTQGATLVVPVSATTSVDSVSLIGLSNLTGTFSIGGITAQAPSEVCPGGVAVPGAVGGSACSVGGGVGGLMGVTGTIQVNVIPGIVVIPFNLGDANLGLGGSLNSPFFFDAAGWTTGTALINTGIGSTPDTGFGGTSSFQLVSPLFVSACGNLLPIFTSLTISGLSAVPEPALWASLWLGLLGIVILTRRK